MIEGAKGSAAVESSGKVEGPEGFQCDLASAVAELTAELTDDGAVLAIAQQSESGLPVPLVLMPEQRHQFLAGFRAEILDTGQSSLSHEADKYVRSSCQFCLRDFGSG